MAKKSKPKRARAETARGVRDYFGADVTRRQRMLEAIAEVYRLHGFDALETPAFETVEALGSFLPDVDRPNAGVFAFRDGGGDDDPWLALRYDMTAPLARVYAQHRADLPTPYRRYAMGPVWRNEKPGPGRYRQFYQCDADTVGTASVAADAEMAALLCDVLEAVGIERGDYVVRVNNRKVLDGVMEAAGIATDDDRVRGIVLRAIDKLDRLGFDETIKLLGKGREDESGDFTQGANLQPRQKQRIVQFFEAGNSVTQQSFLTDRIRGGEKPSDWEDRQRLLRARASGDRSSPLAGHHYNQIVTDTLMALVDASMTGEEGVQELRQVTDLLAAQGYGPDRIVIDPSIVRGLGYYTGPVVEAELTFEVTDDHGRLQRFGSVAGGGRYDDLVTRFTGQAVPATGISIGVDRLLAALEARNADAAPEPGPVVVTVMDRDRMADYQSLCADLRRAGIRAEVYLGNPRNFGNQLKYADRRGSPAAIIQGSDEAARGVVQVKDLILGAKLAEDATLEEWKENPSQQTIPIRDPETGRRDTAKLVEHIRRLQGEER